ncbi:hypothetical protein DYB95_18005 [Vibrio cholerae]|nr:hypothetical protein [Vibrio cholerae]
MVDKAKIKLIHAKVRARLFNPEIDLECFSSSEQELLDKYGSWMESLSNRKIEPYTDEQERFIEVANRKIEPRSDFECLWIKYLNAVNQHKESETKRVMSMVESGALSVIRLNLILVNRNKFNFTDADLERINEEIQRQNQKPHGLSENSFITYSNTDGQ